MESAKAWAMERGEVRDEGVEVRDDGARARTKVWVMERVKVSARARARAMAWVMERAKVWAKARARNFVKEDVSLGEAGEKHLQNWNTR